MENRASPINLLKVVWNAHNTFGSSSVHFPLESFSLHFNLFTNRLVSSFSLSVTLWVGGSRVLVSDTEFCAVPSKSVAVKLESVIRDQNLRYSKSCHNVFLDKPLDVCVSDVLSRLSFDPFSEVICSNQKPSSISRGLWEGSHYV